MLSEDILIYMYQEIFEKLASNLKITNVKQTKTTIEIIVPREITAKINGPELFMDLSDISRMIRFTSRLNNLTIILDIVKLDKHFIYYLIDILKVIEKNIKKETKN